MSHLLEDNLGASAVSSFPVPPTRPVQDIWREPCGSGIFGVPSGVASQAALPRTARAEGCCVSPAWSQLRRAEVACSAQREPVPKDRYSHLALFPRHEGELPLCQGCSEALTSPLSFSTFKVSVK